MAMVCFRSKGVDYEVRAGLSTYYAQKGWVADDVHTESVSRTLDYACAYTFSSSLPPLCLITDLFVSC
jgi:hypothetical protein